jgi:pseudouridine-5'-phosphate glycosidase
LQELATTNVAVVCAGAKSILDIALTREYLETQGVPVVGYQTNTLPAFYTRESDFSVDYRLEHPAEIASAMQHKWQLGIDGGLVIANPIPEAYALSRTEMDSVIEKAISAMNAAGVRGKESTPFLLAKVAEITGGDSLAANIQLVKNNAKLASAIALDYAALNNTN